jgi:hypothetical protein
MTSQSATRDRFARACWWISISAGMLMPDVVEDAQTCSRCEQAAEHHLEPVTRSHSTSGGIENSAPLAALMLCTVLDYTWPG